MSTIVHIGPATLPVTHSRGGAIERRMLELARAQVRRGHRVVVYSADPAGGQATIDGVELRQIPLRYPAALRSVELTRAALRELSNPRLAPNTTARTWGTNVLHFHSVPEGAFLARRIPAVKFLSYDDFRFRRGRATPLFWPYRRMLRQFDGLLPVSEHCRRESHAYWKLDAASAQVVPNGVNLNQFAPDPASVATMRHSLGLGGAPVILYVGRVCHQKGTDVLLDAYSVLQSRIPAVRLVVAGPALRFGNPERSDLTSQLESRGGIYMGAVEEAALSSIYNLCDVFVMPTRRDEMFGMAALEAQACGKPVVCSRLGGLPETISESSGMFFPAGDPGALAQCLHTLIEDRLLYCRLSAAARTNAAMFAWDAIAAECDRVYFHDRTCPDRIRT
jgi:glycosyltransferase involved in cell wall biosynthesis